MVGAIPQSDQVEHLVCALVPVRGLHRAAAAVEQRQLDVVQRRGPQQQIEALEDESNLLVPDRRERVLRHARHVLAVEKIVPRRRLVEAADDVHERGLAGTRRSGDREEFALRHFDVDAAQRLHLVIADDVGLDEVPDRDDVRCAARVRVIHGRHVRGIRPVRQGRHGQASTDCRFRPASGCRASMRVRSRR